MKIDKNYRKRINEATVGELADNLDKEAEKEVKEVARALGVTDREIKDLDDPTDDIAKALTKSLIKAQNALIVHPDKVPAGCNLLFEGNAGTAKTSRIKKWAERHGVNLVTKRAVDLDETDLNGIKAREYDENGKPLNSTNRLTNHEFDALYTPNSVLFLDEVNRARPEVVGSLLMLIQEHTVPDASEEGGERFIPFLFTVAAINPNRGSYQTNDLDPAMKTRFKHKKVVSNKANMLSYLKKYFLNEYKDYEAKGLHEKAHEFLGRFELAKELLSNDDFHFDSDAEEDQAMDNGYNPLNMRTFETVLVNCDGTKEDFLDEWDDECNPAKKEMVEDILVGYVDIDDEANHALIYGDAAAQGGEDDYWNGLGLED